MEGLREYPEFAAINGGLVNFYADGEVMEGLREYPEFAAINGGLVNFYADGGEYIGPHSDDQRQLRRGSPIVSVSWGVSRNFVMVPKKGTQASASLRRVTLLLND